MEGLQYSKSGRVVIAAALAASLYLSHAVGQVLLHIYPAACLRLHCRYLWLTLERLFGEEGRSLDVNGIQYNDVFAVGEVEQRGPGWTASQLCGFRGFRKRQRLQENQSYQTTLCEAACEASVQNNHNRERIDFKTTNCRQDS